MSITATPAHHFAESAQPNHPENGSPLFDGDELRQFAVDDADAGRRIGKILSALFIYTLFAMSVAIWWTFRTLGQ